MKVQAFCLIEEAFYFADEVNNFIVDSFSIIGEANNLIGVTFSVIE